jgi:hypothetical protein
MPRTFTRVELTSTITSAMYDAMSAEDREAFDLQLTALWIGDTAAADARYLQGDYDQVGSRRRYEIGE